MKRVNNLDQFVNAFDSDKPYRKILLKIDNAAITDAHFSVIDENKETPVDIDFTKLKYFATFYSMT
jgi:hypothetical protein